MNQDIKTKFVRIAVLDGYRLGAAVAMFNAAVALGVTLQAMKVLLHNIMYHPVPD